MNHLPSEGNVAGYRVYVAPDLSFSIHLPNDWLLDTSGQQNTVFLAFHPDTKNCFRANINVVVNATTPLTDDEYLTFSRLELKRFTHLSILPVDQPDPNHSNRHIFEWAINKQLNPIKARQQIILADKQAFVVTATASLMTFERHRPEFEAILNSFKLT